MADNKIERALKYLKEEFDINSIEELRAEMNKNKLDIGIFTMPIIYKRD